MLFLIIHMQLFLLNALPFSLVTAALHIPTNLLIIFTQSVEDRSDFLPVRADIFVLLDFFFFEVMKTVESANCELMDYLLFVFASI